MNLRRETDYSSATGIYKAYDNLNYQASEIITRSEEESNTIQSLMVSLEMHDTTIKSLAHRIKNIAQEIKDNGNAKG